MNITITAFSKVRSFTFLPFRVFLLQKRTFSISPLRSQKMPDQVHISGLLSLAIVGLDHWKKPVPHPVSVDVTFLTDFSKALETDDLHYSLNYLVISTKILQFLEKNYQRNFSSLGGVGNAVFNLLEQERKACSEVKVAVSAPKIDIRAPAMYTTNCGTAGTYEIRGLRALSLIGIFTFERLNRQYVTLDLTFTSSNTHVAVGEVSESVQNYIELTNFKTVEALVKLTCQWIFQNFPTVEVALVQVTKPNAIVYTDGVGVSCQYTRAELAGEDPLTSVESSGEESHFNLPVTSQNEFSGSHSVYVAFGSNEGEQLKNINEALDLLHQHPQIKLESTLALYVSKPMYHLDQPDFYNGVVKLSVTDMNPHEVLDFLKEIEYEQLKRTKEFENGPRSIDLDLILFDKALVNTPRLTVPHKAMLDRTFVLQPLCELLPPDFIHPVTAESIHTHLARLLHQTADVSVQESCKLIQLVPTAHGRLLEFNRDGLSPTMLMGVFNVTPDLFSDGGERFNLDKTEILKTAHYMKDQGATIIDVGGVSTRPGSTAPSVEDELSRVVEVIEAIRLDRTLDKIFISVDTYRVQVAEKAIAAGADIINDISMGLFDKDMFAFVARSGCGYVMNHTRGTPATMSKMTVYDANPTPETVVEYFIDEKNGLLNPLPDSTQNLLGGVCREISTQVLAALQKGVRKWQLIVDPGIGFAKNGKQNLALIRHCSRVKRYAQWNTDMNSYVSFHGMALLMGTSRKKFLGEITNTPQPADRAVPTAASIVACIEQGTDVVRVHDLIEARQAAQTADAIYRVE